MSLRKFLITGASALALCPAAAFAQADSPQGATDTDSNDIIVTATRREASVLKTPVSMEAYSQEKLDIKGVRSIEDLARMTPGVSINQGTFGIKYLVVRGLTSSVGATMNGVYIDDTPVQVRSVSLTTNFYPAMFDLERVEVLRGPQGTLFGASAMGGAVRFITAKPGLDKFSGYGRAEIGFTEGGSASYEGGAAVGGPLVQDKIGFRASIYYRHDGGYVDRVPLFTNFGFAEKNANTRDTFVGNFAMTFKPTEDITITPGVFFQQANRHGDDQVWEWRPGTVNPFRPVLPAWTNRDNIDGQGKDRATIYSLKAEFDMGPATIISNTAYNNRRARNVDDLTGFFKDLLGQRQVGGALETALGVDFRSYYDLKMTQKSFVQELRVQSNPSDSKLSYVAGLFFQSTKQGAIEFDLSPNPGGIVGLIPLIPAVNGNLGYLLDSAKDRQFAVFGQLDYKLTDTISVSAGLRYSYVTFDFKQVGGNNLPTDVVTTGRTSENPITPKFGIEYNPSDDLMFYASAGKGFRPGGSNSVPVTSTLSPECRAALLNIGYTETPRSYESDSTWSYEIGAKGRVGGAVTFAADVFQIDWTNVQRTRSVPNCGNPFIDNLGASRARGVEAKITLTPTRGLTLDANLSYTDATVAKTLVRGPYVDAAGKPQPADEIVTKGDRFAPKWLVSLTGDYETEIGNGLTGYAHLQYDYRSGYNTPTGNAGFIALYGRVFQRDFVSARLGIRTGGVDISAYVNNLLDSKQELARLVLGGDPNPVGSTSSDRLLRTLYRPRTWGVTASYRF
jgi:outer membrane receptor protein involved in Fe transport